MDARAAAADGHLGTRVVLHSHAAVRSGGGSTGRLTAGRRPAALEGARADAPAPYGADDCGHSPGQGLLVSEDDLDLPRGIGAPATRAPVGAGYSSLGQLAGVSATELAALRGIGPKALRILQEALTQQGLSLS